MTTTATQESTSQTTIDFEHLGARLGMEKFRRRMHLQIHHNEGFIGQSEGFFALEDYMNLPKLIEFCFKATGLYKKGRANFLDIQIEHNTVTLKNLPSAFDGFRILQIADLHSDLDPDLPDAVITKLMGLEYDICVNTGDFRNGTKNCYKKALDAADRIAQKITAPHYGVLGNHDFIEKVPNLEKMGIQMLLNESVPIERNGSQIWLSGVDDARFYKTHDLEKAQASIPPQACKILLSHSPELYNAAAENGYAFMLSGHTHGGQVCLPKKKIVFKHCDCPMEMASGAWEHNTLKGYTSRGTGAGTTAVRFNCPPELTIHTLVKG